MAKPKIDFKQLLLKRGEYIALGIAGFVLLLLLISGVSSGAGTADPDAISKELNNNAQAVHSKIANGEGNPDPIPEAIRSAGGGGKSADPRDFALTGQWFDPTAKPDTKRENPLVMVIGDYQVDLVRAPMKGYDIVVDNQGNASIAVKVTKDIKGQDKTKVDDALKDIRRRGGKAGANMNRPRPPAPPPMGGGGPGGPPMGPGGAGGPGGPPMGPGMGGMGGMGPPGAGGGIGLGGSGFDHGSQRSEQFITYIPLDDVDKAMAETPPKTPAVTVIPLRMAVIHATFPLKAQLEEVKRAMRLRTTAEAYQYVHFDGFDVQRRVSRIMPDGKVQEIEPWADYEYEKKYIELIHSRKIADHFDVTSNPRTQYLPYFFRYDEAMAMPLPELVPEIGGYPEITLGKITDTIAKLEAARAPKESPSDLADRLNKKGGEGRRQLFNPTNGDNASTLFGQGGSNAPGTGSGKKDPKGPVGPGGGNLDNQQVEIDHLLIRFVDCDVRPGRTYEYRLRVRMNNPNWKKPATMSNPKLATEPQYEFLTSPWTELTRSLTVPAESFLYAADPAAYRKQIEEAYPGGGGKYMKEKLQARDDQAVIEVQSWMEQVKIDSSGKREPVGAWVVAEMPVSRGDYIGKKTYIKLPLWSSADTAYVLRELPDNVIKKGREQPKGWLVDFSTRSVLVDFEGGKVQTKLSGNRVINEEVATELLIVRPDGKLMVRSSETDAQDPLRKEYETKWSKWLSEVEKRKTGGGTGAGGEFDRSPGGNPPKN